jgi:HD-like signal output (HDOD) protein
MDVRQNSRNDTVVVRVDELREGMVLAEDMRHFNGRLILNKGSVLGSKDIRIIKMWGVTETKILDRGEFPVQEMEMPDPRALKPIEPFIHEHLRLTDLSHEVIGELYRLCLFHYAYSGDRIVVALTFPHPPTDERLAEQPAELLPITDPNGVIRESQLPSLPSIVQHLLEAINNPRCTATHIADIISTDTNLSARLLKLVNSAFYNFPSEITSIARAVAIVGSRQLSMLALGTMVITVFKNIPTDFINMASFWKHSVACGIVARILSSYKSNTNTENYFLAGLLHDIGRLLIYRNFPYHVVEIMNRASKKPQMLYHLEKEILGIDHMELGGLLIKEWKLSTLFESACRYHHFPLESQDPIMPSIVHLADLITNAMYFGNSGEAYVPPIDTAAWEQIGLPVSVLTPTVTQTALLLKETIRVYLPEQYHKEPFEDEKFLDAVRRQKI